MDPLRQNYIDRSLFEPLRNEQPKRKSFTEFLKSIISKLIRKKPKNEEVKFNADKFSTLLENAKENPDLYFSNNVLFELLNHHAVRNFQDDFTRFFKGDQNEKIKMIKERDLEIDDAVKEEILVCHEKLETLAHTINTQESVITEDQKNELNIFANRLEYLLSSAQDQVKEIIKEHIIPNFEKQTNVKHLSNNTNMAQNIWNRYHYDRR